jgi:leucyl-tRNA synthetase
MFHVIDSYAINHAFKNHGVAAVETLRGQIALSDRDFEALPQVAESPDRILKLGTTRQGRAVIGFVKQINGALLVVEEVHARRNLLSVVTIYKKQGTASDAEIVACSSTSETFRSTRTVVHFGKPINPTFTPPDLSLPEYKDSRALGVSPSPGVDLYVGGTEHAVLHLLYARFWHKVLFDLGYLSTPEPFQRLVNQGMILGEDGRKMSKRWGNVIDPLDVIAEYGADAFRCYEMFMGPLEQMKPWSMNGVEGVARFLARVWRLVMEENQAGEWVLSGNVQEATPEKAQLKILYATIKKVTTDIETLSFNTAISQMMILVNSLINASPKPVSALRPFPLVLNPFAPHLTSELWQVLQLKFGGPPGDITAQGWPDYDEELLIEDEVEIVIQVNGKVRDKIVMPLEATDAEVETAALASPKLQEHIAGKMIRKVIVVPKKLVNIVTA